MSEVIDEIYIKKSPVPISIEQMKKIIFQMENCICKIYKNGSTGTGFFCKIPLKDKDNFLRVLITNNHVLDENDIEDNKYINFSINNKQIYKKILIDKSRIRFTKKDNDIDVTIIEIKENDDIKNYLELEENDLIQESQNLELEYREKSVYILHYPRGDEIKVSYGIIKNKNVRSALPSSPPSASTGSI